MNTPNEVRVPARLELRPVPWAAVAAIVTGARLPDWAEDFPTTADRAIARMLHQAGRHEAERRGPWGHYQVVERAGGAVVGGIGFRGPPQDGVTEIGYGIVPSRQGRGYATEAVTAVLLIAWEQPEANTVIAHTEFGNLASQRVLGKAGFALEASAAQRRYRIDRPARPARAQD
jgi:[ribosomal protein S5]-alanine N-acetyltransferase